jgi:tetratricopeptide (TPR) repeat protein
MIGTEQIQGRIFYPRGAKPTSRPIIKLWGISSNEITAMADQDGSFRFTHLRPDQYTLVIDAGDEYERVNETVDVTFSAHVAAQGFSAESIMPLTYPVEIYLKPINEASNAFANVPVPAQELFQQARESARTGDNQKAIEQLKSAISQAPKFALAYSELAAQYLKAGQTDQALAVLKEAIIAVPDDLGLRLKYGIALMNRKKYQAAEAELLRLANVKDYADAPTAGYYLGLALMNEEKMEAAQSVFETVIKNGGEKLALAHKYLGGIYWHNKQYRPAVAELEKYLKLEPKAADAEKIRGSIKELRHKS